jgi:hypothetical protein
MDFIQIEELPLSTVPQKIFIVPYRSRIQHKFFLSKYMTFLLEDEAPGNYEIYFSHQSDDRPFNRGATKNIGFLAMKRKYPNDYKNMTFIFNDVDTIPFNKIFNYDTTEGIVQHLYGFHFALGGIVIFKGADFEKINGYPNFWGWGQEDNVLQLRCNKYGLVIDRSQFYGIGSHEILQFFDGIKRIVVRTSHQDAKDDNGVDGLKSIYRLSYTIDTESSNPNDNIYTVVNPYIFVINIKSFMTLTNPEEKQFASYDLRDKPGESIKVGPRFGMKLETAKQNTQQKQPKPQKITPLAKTINPSVNIFSSQYAKNMGIKERATASSKIGIGGIQR